MEIESLKFDSSHTLNIENLYIEIVFKNIEFFDPSGEDVNRAITLFE